MSNSNSNVIMFPKTTAKTKPEPPKLEQRKPWWQHNAEWMLRLAQQHPEINVLLGDRTRLFLLQMETWPNEPSPKQKAWLVGVADMVEAKEMSLKARAQMQEQSPPPDVA